MSSSDTTVSGLSAAMRFDHERLEIGARHLLECALFGRADIVERAYVRLSRELVAHLEAEELALLPAFEREHAASAATLREEHEILRAALDVLDEQVARHAVKPSVVRKLVALLREHAVREEAELYPWAETNVHASESKAALEHIRAADAEEDPTERIVH